MRRLSIVVIVIACSAAALQARQAATTPAAPQPAPAAPVVQPPAPPPPAPAIAAPSAPSRGRSAAQATTRPQGRGGPTPTTPTAPAPPPAPAAPPAPPAPPRKLPSQNVRFDVTITDTFGTGPSKKTVSMLVADARTGQIRSSMQIPQPISSVPAGPGAPITNFTYTSIVLNIDATPEVLSDGRIFVTMNVQYTPDIAQELGGSRKPGSLNEVLAVVLADAKQTLISQSAEPQGDRKVTLEVTATVVK